MITKFKIFENEDSTLEDFYNLKVGDVLIAKHDIYIDYPNRIQKNYRGTELASFGDKLFIKKGQAKKILKIIYNGVRLAGFYSVIKFENLYEHFTIKNLELIRNIHNFNL